jgi:hypothetical protein
MDEKLKEAMEIIKDLCRHLPDACRAEGDWDWCWNELSDDSQEKVKEARERANVFMREVKRSKYYE